MENNRVAPRLFDLRGLFEQNTRPFGAQVGAPTKNSRSADVPRNRPFHDPNMELSADDFGERDKMPRGDQTGVA